MFAPSTFEALGEYNTRDLVVLIDFCIVIFLGTSLSISCQQLLSRCPKARRRFDGPGNFGGYKFGAIIRRSTQEKITQVADIASLSQAATVTSLGIAIAYPCGV